MFQDFCFYTYFIFSHISEAEVIKEKSKPAPEKKGLDMNYYSSHETIMYPKIVVVLKYIYIFYQPASVFI